METNNVSRELSTETLNNAAIKEKIAIGEPKLIDVKGKSKIWEIFHQIPDQHATIVPNIVSCKICKNIYKYNKSSTSNLVKHKCYSIKKLRTDNMDAPIEPFGDDKAESARLFTKWTLQNCRPFKIVEDSGLQEVLKFFILVLKIRPGINLKSLCPIAQLCRETSVNI
ncbi:hypothetical protein DOY81_008923 [Sarcophaga bullata]|nr:hypothetical protein DOY81_008923 [Sarcophaga bullata]